MIVENERSGIRHLADDNHRTYCGLDAQNLNVVDLPSLEKEKEYMYCTCRMCLRVQKMRINSTIYHRWEELYQDILRLKDHISTIEYCLSQRNSPFLYYGEKIYEVLFLLRYHLSKIYRKGQEFHPLIQENYARLHLLFEEEKGEG